MCRPAQAGEAFESGVWRAPKCGREGRRHQPREGGEVTMVSHTAAILPFHWVSQVVAMLPFHWISQLLFYRFIGYHSCYFSVSFDTTNPSPNIMTYVYLLLVYNCSLYFGT